MMKSGILLAPFFGVFCGATADADFILADRGIAPASIVVFQDAPPRTREAAVTLADYIEKISGSRPDVLDGEPRPLPQRAIWVGVQPAVKELFPQLDFAFAHPEEILIAANEKHLVIAGRDRWDPQRLDVEGREGKISGKQQEYGTANAVYTFLQDGLDVRWLWPGELGEDVIPRRTICFAPFAYRFYPSIRSRAGVLQFSALGNKGYGRSHDWARLQRLQLHSLDISGGHGFSDWWERFHVTHPDFFALQPDGTRSGHPSPKNAKICESNPAVWQQWLADVAAQLERDPTQSVFNASPNDGWASGHCVCDNCRAWDHSEGEPRLFFWAGTKKTLPALTDRDVTFANRLGELLKERYPGKDYRVLMLSYGHSRPAPIKAVPADNVIISSVANFLGRTNLQDDGSPRGTTHRQQFEAWTKLARHLVWRPNTGSPAGWQQGLPDVSLSQTIEDFQLVAASGCLGIYIDSVWEHWATQGPQYYVMAQLTWNPRQDGRAVLDDYYRRGFGPAAASVRRYFDTIEQARMEYVAKNGYAAGAINLGKHFTPRLLDAAESHLRQAADAAAQDRDVYRRRVEWVRAGCHFTRLVAENARLMSGYWEQPDETAAARVRKNWEQMESICQTHPFAINWGPVRPTTPRMAGLHPEHPNPKRNNPKPNRKPPANDLDQN
jgi:hypothetical protein